MPYIPRPFTGIIPFAAFNASAAELTEEVLYYAGLTLEMDSFTFHIPCLAFCKLVIAHAVLDRNVLQSNLTKS